MRAAALQPCPPSCACCIRGAPHAAAAPPSTAPAAPAIAAPPAARRHGQVARSRAGGGLHPELHGALPAHRHHRWAGRRRNGLPAVPLPLRALLPLPPRLLLELAGATHAASILTLSPCPVQCRLAQRGRGRAGALRRRGWVGRGKGLSRRGMTFCICPDSRRSGIDAALLLLTAPAVPCPFPSSHPAAAGRKRERKVHGPKAAGGGGLLGGAGAYGARRAGWWRAGWRTLLLARRLLCLPCLPARPTLRPASPPLRARHPTDQQTRCGRRRPPTPCATASCCAPAARRSCCPRTQTCRQTPSPPA